VPLTGNTDAVPMGPHSVAVGSAALVRPRKTRSAGLEEISIPPIPFQALAVSNPSARRFIELGLTGVVIPPFYCLGRQLVAIQK
jgi:hypothetical protein